MVTQTNNLSTPSLVYAHAFSIAKSCARMLKSIRRTSDYVKSEYNDGHWNKILTEKKWKNCKTLEEYLYPPSLNKEIICLLDGKYSRLSSNDYYRARDKELAGYVAQYLSRDADTVVEIGSGTGRNLFALAFLMPQIKFLGLDISEKGLQASREVAEHFGLQERFEFAHLDLTDPKHPNFSKLAGKNGFSFFCLEQIPMGIRNALENILNAGMKTVVHIEPNIWHLNLANPADWANYVYIKSVDYQTDLPKCLEDLQKDGRIKILEQKPVGFAPTVQNRGLLSVWTRAK